MNHVNAPGIISNAVIEVRSTRRGISRNSFRRQIFQYIWLPWVFLFALKLIAPMEFSNNLFYTYLCITGAITFWSLCALNSSPHPIHVVMPIDRAGQILAITWTLFIIFIPITYINFFFLEARSLLTAVEERQQLGLEGQDGSVVGGVIAILTATPVVLIVMRRLILGVRKARLINLFILAGAIPTLLFSGGRNPLVLSLLFLFIAQRLMNLLDPTASRRGINFQSIRQIITIGAIGSAVFSYIGYVSITRREVQGTLNEYGTVLIQNYDVRLTPLFDALEQIDTGLSVAYANLYYYLQHSVSILDRLVEIDNIGTGGYATFPLYTVIWEFIAGGDFVNTFVGRLQFRGSYTTIWGALYSDGGYIFMLFGTALIGVFFMCLMRMRTFGPSLILITNSVLLTVAVAPIYCLTSTGFGSSLIFVILLVSLAGSISFNQTGR